MKTKRRALNNGSVPSKHLFLNFRKHSKFEKHMMRTPWISNAGEGKYKPNRFGGGVSISHEGRVGRNCGVYGGEGCDVMTPKHPSVPPSHM